MTRRIIGLFSLILCLALTSQTFGYGVTWSQATGSASFPARRQHTCLTFGGNLWVIGGHGTSGSLNDVWSSVDGVTWTQATASAPWSAR